MVICVNAEKGKTRHRQVTMKQTDGKLDRRIDRQDRQDRHDRPDSQTAR